MTDKESLAAAKQEIDFLRLLEMVVFDNFLSHFFYMSLTYHLGKCRVITTTCGRKMPN